MKRCAFIALLALALLYAGASPAAVDAQSSPRTPPGVPSMVLPARALGSEWVMIDRVSDRGSEQLQYFNNAVEQSRFRTATITLDMYVDRQQTRASTDDARSALEGFRFEVAPAPDFDRGGGFRAVQVDAHGLVHVIRLFEIENVALSVSLTGTGDQHQVEDVDAEDLNVAAVQRARVEAVLAGQPVADAPPAEAWPSVPDPTPLVLTADQVGPGWIGDAESDKGAPEDLLRTHTHMFRSDADEGALIAVTLARDEATARMALGMFLADWHTKGYTLIASDNLVAGSTFPTYAATRRWAPDLAEAGYLYQAGRAVVQVSITSRGLAPDEVLPVAADWSRWQALRVLNPN